MPVCGIGDFFCKNVETSIEKFVSNHERRKEPNHIAIDAGTEQQ